MYARIEATLGDTLSTLSWWLWTADTGIVDGSLFLARVAHPGPPLSLRPLRRKKDGNGDVPAGSCQVAMFSCYVVSMVTLSEHVYWSADFCRKACNIYIYTSTHLWIHNALQHWYQRCVSCTMRCTTQHFMPQIIHWNASLDHGQYSKSVGSGWSET